MGACADRAAETAGTSDWLPSPAASIGLPAASAGSNTLVRTALPDGTGIGGIAWRDGLFVVVGASGILEGQATPTAWTSNDGAAWTEGGGVACEGAFTAVAATRAGFVAAGTCATRMGPTTLLIATSVDGQRWDRAVVEAPDLASWSQGDGWVGDGIAMSAGSLVVIAGGEGRTRVWVSADGRTWRNGAPVGSPGGASVSSVGSGFLVIGNDGSGDPGAWFSPDALSWVVSAVPDGLWSIAPTGQAFMALGPDRGAWWSADGGSWLERPMAPAGLIRLVPASGGVMGISTDDGLQAWWTTTGDTWTPFAQTVVDGQPLHPAAAVAANGRLVVVVAREKPNPNPDVMQVTPEEILVWLVPLGR
jgi:hypothetical protein